MLWKKKTSVPPSLWRGDQTYFLFLFLAVSDPAGSSTSMLSSSRRSFRPAAPPALRLFAVCFSRKRSATSLSAELRASSCSVSSRTLTVLCSARVTSFESSVCRTVAVVCDLFILFQTTQSDQDENITDQFSKEDRISVTAAGGTSLPIVYSTSNCCSFWSSLPRMMSR